MNQFKKQQEPEQLKKKEKKKKSFASSRRFLKLLNVFGLVEKGLLMKVMPFIFFLTGIGLIYIANSHVADKNIREIDKTTKEIKELKSEYTITKADLMNKSIQSAVQKEVLPLGLKEAMVPPKKIIVNK